MNSSTASNICGFAHFFSYFFSYNFNVVFTRLRLSFYLFRNLEVVCLKFFLRLYRRSSFSLSSQLCLGFQASRRNLHFPTAL